MSADLDASRQFGSRRARTYAVTVLAPLGDPEDRTDLERPEAAVLEVFDAVAKMTRVAGRAPTQVLPVRRKDQPGQYGVRHRSVEMLDATTLEDVAEALGDDAPRVVHAVGWEAGVVAAAVRQSNVTPDGEANSVVVLEPLGAPGSPEWSLADHAAALVVQSELHRRASLRHGIAAGLLHVVPPAAPRCPVGVAAERSDEGCAVLAVVGDGLEAVVLDVVEHVLRGSPDMHVVFAGAAGRDVRERRHAQVVRSWPATLSARVHAATTVTWQLLARVDAVVEIGTPPSSPRAALAAMAAARAVLAIGDSPATEIVCHGRTGLRLPAGDPRRTAAGVLRVATDPELLHRFGRAAHGRWAGEHAPEVRARRLTAVYDSVAD